MEKWSKAAFAGYLAGMLDGEGSIEIIGDWSVRVRIANTYRPMLEAMRCRLGFGKVWQYARPKNKEHWKRLYVLEVSNATDLSTFFKLCNPFVHIKRDRLDQARTIVRRIMGEAAHLDRRNRAILQAISKGQEQKAIAAKFGVSPQLVSRVKKGHLWPSVISGHRARELSKRFPRGSDQSFRLHGAP